MPSVSYLSIPFPLFCFALWHLSLTVDIPTVRTAPGTQILVSTQIFVEWTLTCPFSPVSVPRGDRGLGCVWLHPLPSYSAAAHRPLPDAGPASWLPPRCRRRGSRLTTTQPPSLCLLGEVGLALTPDCCCSPAHGQETLGWTSL